MEESLTNKELRHIILVSDEVLKLEAEGRLLNQSPSNDDLCCIISNDSFLGGFGYKIEAGIKLLNQSPSNNDLRCIITDIESLAVEAGQKVLLQNPTNDDLCLVECIESLKKQVEDYRKNRK